MRGIFKTGLNSLSQSLTVLPAPSGREPLARPEGLRFSWEVPTCLKRAGTLRWARGREGCSDSPLPTSGLHPPRNWKGAARPFQTPKRRSNRKKSSRFAQRFFLGSPSKPPQPLRRQLPKWGAGSGGRKQLRSPSAGLSSQSPAVTDSPFCRCATSSPGAGEVFPQRGSLWRNRKLCT